MEILFLSHSVLTVSFIESRNMRCGKHGRDEIFTQVVELGVLVLDVPSFVAPQKAVGGGALERSYHTLCWKVLPLRYTAAHQEVFLQKLCTHLIFLINLTC
jgi:hypothetical protein